MNYVLLIIGLVLILGGANYLTDGAAAIARKFGLSNLIVGLTIVAFGTSAPELTISVMSAVDGNTGMAIGNVVGSNIFNTLLIIGAVALARPIHIGKGIMINEIPLVILASVAILAMGCSPWLDGTAPEIRASTASCCYSFSSYSCAMSSHRPRNPNKTGPVRLPRPNRSPGCGCRPSWCSEASQH